MKDKKPLYCVLSLKLQAWVVTQNPGCRSHIYKPSKQDYFLFSKTVEKISQATGNIVSHFIHVIKTCFYIALWSVNWKQHHFSEWEETILREIGKTAQAAWLTRSLDRIPSLAYSFIHSSTDTRVLPPIHLATHHSSISPPRHPSSIHPSSLHRPAFHPPTHRLSIIHPSLLFADPLLISHRHNSKWDFFSPKLNQKRKKFNIQPFPYLSSHEFLSKLSYFK